MLGCWICVVEPGLFGRRKRSGCWVRKGYECGATGLAKSEMPWIGILRVYRKLEWVFPWMKHALGGLKLFKSGRDLP